MNETSKTKTLIVKRSGLFGVFQRHYKWIAIVSGLVVSLTLSLRDHFHERAKDYASSTENAENLGQLGRQSNIINGRLEVIAKDMAELRKRSNKSAIEAFTDGNNDLELLFLFSQQELLAKSASLDRLTELLTEKERKQYGEKQADLLIEILGIKDHPDFSQYEGKSLKEVMEGIDLAQRNAMLTARNISEKFDRLQKQALHRLQEGRKEYERQERIYGFMSYAIIGIGVGLSLLAKLFEPAGTEAEVAGMEEP